jgi:uncharacterized OsmC-like protein
MSRAVTVIGGPSVLRQAISVGPHHLIADEPKTSGGSDAGRDPYELLLSALGSCTNMTLRMYADRKKWPLKRFASPLHIRKTTPMTASTVSNRQQSSIESIGGLR